MRTTIYLAVLGAIAATGAQAVTITFGGTPLAGQGLISSVVGVPTEGFDTPSDAYGACGTPPQAPTGLSISAPDGVSFFDIRNDSVQFRRLAPAGDTSCYVVVSDEFVESGSVNVDFNFEAASPNAYAGFYWGSPDEYNELQLLDSLGNPLSLGGFGDTISGDEATAAAGLAPYTSLYINFRFDVLSEEFASFRVSTTNWAFEFDNVSISTDDSIVLSSPASFAALKLDAFAEAEPFQVAEPGMPLALAGAAGLLALARRRRA